MARTLINTCPHEAGSIGIIAALLIERASKEGSARKSKELPERIALSAREFGRARQDEERRFRKKTNP